MLTPFVPDPLAAATVAQTATAGLMSALVLRRPLPAARASAWFVASIWLTALAPWIGGRSGATVAVALLTAGAACIVALACTRAWRSVALFSPSLLAIAAYAAYADNARIEAAALQLLGLGAILGIHYRDVDIATPIARPRLDARDHLADDIVVCAIAVVAAALASTFALERFANSGDEVAATYQALLYADGKS